MHIYNGYAYAQYIYILFLRTKKSDTKTSNNSSNATFETEIYNLLI